MDRQGRSTPKTFMHPFGQFPWTDNTQGAIVVNGRLIGALEKSPRRLQEPAGSDVERFGRLAAARRSRKTENAISAACEGPLGQPTRAPEGYLRLRPITANPPIASSDSVAGSGTAAPLWFSP